MIKYRIFQQLYTKYNKKSVSIYSQGTTKRHKMNKLKILFKHFQNKYLKKWSGKNATQALYPPAAVKLEQINFKTVIITQWGLCPSSIQFTHCIMNIASFKSVQFACYQSSVTGIAARLACKVNNNNNKIVVFYFALS